MIGCQPLDIGPCRLAKCADMSRPSSDAVTRVSAACRRPPAKKPVSPAQCTSGLDSAAFTRHQAGRPLAARPRAATGAMQLISRFFTCGVGWVGIVAKASGTAGAQQQMCIYTHSRARYTSCCHDRTQGRDQQGTRVGRQHHDTRAVNASAACAKARMCCCPPGASPPAPPAPLLLG
jgi:hypothetical protein